MIEIRAIGLQRSGNHAILNWIAGLFEGPVWFLNNCEPNADPFAQREQTSGLPCLSTTSPITGGNPEVVLHSYEERKLEVIRNQPRRSSRWDNGGRFDVVILRDPFNTLASRIEVTRNAGWIPPSKNGVEFNILWRQYAHEFAGRTKYFPNRVSISFNRWLTDREYRCDVAAKFNRPTNDATMNQVSEYGYGSSFDGTALEGKQLQVMDRWRKYQDDATFRRIFEDKELVALSRELFPNITNRVMRAVITQDGKTSGETPAELLMDHAREPYHHGQCDNPTHVGRFANPSCGDFSQIEFRVDDDDRIEGAWFQSQGCIINRAGGSILTDHIEGMTLEEVSKLTEKDVLSLLGSAVTPRRQICFLITYFALRDALGCVAALPPNDVSKNRGD